MGNSGNRVIEVEHLNEEISKCHLIEKRNCPVYGEMHLVEYIDTQFYLALSHSNQPPRPDSVHYYVPPTTLIIPEFQLLEDICPSSHDELLEIIEGIAEMGHNSQTIGIGYNRVAFAGRWSVVGEKPCNWAYSQIFQNQTDEGAYLSPQLMIALSQNQRHPKHNEQKSDVYALGIMLIEIIFQEKLQEIFDYDNFQIRLNPLLEKLVLVRENAGEEIYQLLVGMLETEEEDRLGFVDVFQIAEGIRRSRMNSSVHSRDSKRRNRTPNRVRGEVSRTPKINATGNRFRNDVSPLRGRLPQNNPKKAPSRLQTYQQPQQHYQNDRNHQNSRSPIRRALQINTQENATCNTNKLGFRPLSPISRRQ